MKVKAIAETTTEEVDAAIHDIVQTCDDMNITRTEIDSDKQSVNIEQLRMLYDPYMPTAYRGAVVHIDPSKPMIVAFAKIGKNKWLLRNEFDVRNEKTDIMRTYVLLDLIAEHVKNLAVEDTGFWKTRNVELIIGLSGSNFETEGILWAEHTDYGIRVGVQSSSSDKEYVVSYVEEKNQWRCSCPAWTRRTGSNGTRIDCKHIFKVMTDKKIKEMLKSG